ncbi:WW domain-containing oxidoreductase [Paramyrothecium foliicola]|nr:WW domain-containing oxidoreductase [Paramyrothecium foliicola]
MTARCTHSVLITGGTSGLGYQCALNIAKAHPEYRVVIASRSDREKGAEKINKELGQTSVRFMPLDLANLDNVRSFAKHWKREHFPPIRSLVLNAALQFPGDLGFSHDGFEQTFAISHIGHALLFALLRPHLADTARIVITASGVHDPEQRSGMPDAEYVSAELLAHPPSETAQTDGRRRYTSTKLANVLYGHALYRRLEAYNSRHGKRWTVTMMDPGLMPGTGLAREYSSLLQWVWNNILPKIVPLLRIFHHNIHTVEESGLALTRLVIGQDVEGRSGIYYEGMKEIKSSKVSYDTEKQEDLWGWTVKTLSQDEGEKQLFNLAE